MAVHHPRKETRRHGGAQGRRRPISNSTIAKRDRVARGDCRDRQVPLAEVAHDIRLDRMQSRRAYTAALGLRRRVLMRTDAQSDEVENMR